MNVLSHPLQLLPLVDVAAQYQCLGWELDRAILSALAKGKYILGPEVEQFEEAFANYTGASHCVTASSGTAALHLVLRACGVGPGDEVIVPALTFVASASPVSLVGATPVFCDVQWETGGLDVKKLSALITPRTVAIIAVHLYGRALPMHELCAIAKRHNLLLIEDCCQAHGARIGSQHVGTFGHAGVFSFYPGKNLGTCGDGGAIITNDAALAQCCRQLRDHGQCKRYLHACLGYNYRMSTIQAAALLTKLPYLDQWNQQRRQAARFYTKALSPLPLWTPPYVATEEHVWHLYTVRTPLRQELALWLNLQGSAYGLHYPLPLHLQPAYQHLGYRPGDFPVAEQIARETLTLPLFPEITETQQRKVIRALYTYFGRPYEN